MARWWATVEPCNGTVIVHEDRSFTCTNVDCTTEEPVEAVVSYHASFVACRNVLAEEGCPRCGLRLFAR